MANERDFWFPAKRFGWGWGPPVKWQGWAVLAAYLLLVAAIIVRFPPHRELVPFLVLVFLATMALLAICWAKGEPPRWRWGDKDRPGN